MMMQCNDWFYLAAGLGLTAVPAFEVNGQPTHFASNEGSEASCYAAWRVAEESSGSVC